MKYEARLKKRWILITSLLIAFGGISYVAIQGFVTAQTAGQGLEVSPPSQEVSIDPGATTIVKAKIRNPGSNTLPIEVHVEDFTAKGDEGQVELNASSPYSVASWTTISPTKFELAPGESQEVTATIKAPQDAAGGRFGSFVFGVKSSENGENTASVAQEVASLFLVRVSGPVDEKLKLNSISAPAFSEFGPVTFDLAFSNSGNVHVKTYGLVNVTDMFGNKVADIVVKGTNVFPGADRIIKAQLDKQFLFGNYTATALMYYGAQNENLQATTTFFVFPVRIAVGILFVLLIIYFMRKRLKKSLKALFR